MNADAVVRASGGLVVRERDGAREVLIVHRPRYDDWSFPKGKRDLGETDEETALREVHEEAGLVCTLGAELPTVRYRDHRGRPKVVRYWVMQPAFTTGGTDPTHDTDFTPNEEVDEVVWCAPAAAATLLTYDHDRGLLAHLENAS